MIGMHRRISGAITMLTLTALVLTGCTSEASNIGRAQDKDGEPDVVDTGFTLSTVGSYDSADTAVVLSTDPDNKAVSFINMDTGKQYTLYYDGTTYVKDKHDGPMSISQIKAGDVVDVTFLKGRKKLASIKRSPEAWVYDEIRNYDLAGTNRTASIGSQMYSLPEGVVVLSEGRRVETGEVVSQDVVTISGINHKIYSVNVDRGHGYLRLKNDQPLLGGWIEVGNSVIRQITEDMLLTVPEGSYQVVLTNNNVGCVKEVTVERGKEVVLDVSDLEVAEDAVGKILFTVEPESATVSVDGKPVDISKPVELKYGIHQIQAEASGYDTLTKHIQVGSEYATIAFKLEESRKNEENGSVSDNSTIPDRIPWQDTLDSISANNLKRDSISDNTLSVSENALGTSNNYKVYVDSPKDVEVYLDGNYVGISPVRFTKAVGRHEITLKKSGYKTKTYTIYLENTRRDETYSFSALEKEGAESGTKKNIPKEVASAISELSGCKLTNGTDVAIEGDLATLQSSGKKIVETAVKNAVKAKIGEAEADKYTFTVEDNLMSVTPPGSEDGKGTVAVTIYRAGYQSQAVSCNVVIVKKAGENPPEPTITVEVKPNTITMAKGSTQAFEAHIKVDGTEKSDASVTWDVKGVDNNIISPNTGFKTEGEPSTLTVASDESATELTVTATYTDSNQTSSGQAKVTIAEKASEEVDVAFWIMPDEAEEKIRSVSVDGRPYGKDFPLKLTCGEHTITVEAEGYEKWEKSVMISEDKKEVLIEFEESSKPEGSKDPNDEEKGEQDDGTGGGQNGKDESIVEGGSDLNDMGGTNTEEGSSSEVGNGDTQSGLTTTKVEITQESHPIRKWFSSLFNK